MAQVEKFGRTALFVTGKNVTVHDIDDILKKAHNQLKATAGSTDTNILYLVPALDSPSLRVPKGVNSGTSSPVNPSFHSPWLAKAFPELISTLKIDLPRLGAFIKPVTFLCADDRTASDGSLVLCVITGMESVESVRLTARAAALHLSRNTEWDEVKRRWNAIKEQNGDVLDINGMLR